MVAATVHALAALGIACAVRHGADGVVRIDGETRRPWYRLLLGAHPQRVRGLVQGPSWPPGRAPGSGAPSPEPSGDLQEGEVRLSLDLFFVAWYRRLVVALWGSWIIGLSALFWFTDSEQFQGGDRPASSLLVSIFVTLALVAWIPFLLRALGGARIQTMLWQPILRAIDRDGGYLEPERTGAGRRFGFWFVGYGTSFFLLGGGALVLDALETSWSTSPVWFWFLVVLVALAGLLIGSAFALGVWRGLGLRVEAIVLGIGSSVVVLFLFTTPLLPAMTVSMTQNALRSDPDAVAWWVRMVLGGALLIWIFGLVLGLYLVSLSRYLWRPLQRTYLLRGRAGIYREAARGGALLAAARGFFGAYAAVLLGVMVAALCMTAAWAAQALGLADFEAFALHAPVAWGPLLAVAMGLPRETVWIGLVARGAWVGWALFVWGLVGMSVGQLALRRRRLRRNLLDRTPKDEPKHRILAERAKRVTRGKGTPTVYLAVRSGNKAAGDEGGDGNGEQAKGPIGACSYRFAWPRRQWFIEVTEGAVAELAPDELEALLAHELAHLRCGHVLAYDLLRWVGRLAFLGDGFCRGLLDSFGWELRADREAALALGDRRQALIHCLWRIAAVNPAVPSLGGPEGLGIDAPAESAGAGDPGDAVVPGWSGLRIAWRRFLRQYAFGSTLEYWHPSSDERVERIRRIEAVSTGPGRLDRKRRAT